MRPPPQLRKSSDDEVSVTEVSTKISSTGIYNWTHHTITSEIYGFDADKYIISPYHGFQIAYLASPYIRPRGESIRGLCPHVIRARVLRMLQSPATGLL
jgi:hypothetical protein